MATRGRKPRKRASGAGSAVSVGGHGRSPRGPDAGKPRVKVKSYKRGKPRKRRGRRKRR